MIRLYTASKIPTGKIWRLLEKDPEWNHVFFASRWLRHYDISTPDTPENASKFWQEDQSDVQKADALVILGFEGEHLRGALIEAGMAIAYGIPVIAVGNHIDYGAWQYHPLVHRVDTLKDAAKLLKLLDK